MSQISGEGNNSMLNQLAEIGRTNGDFHVSDKGELRSGKMDGERHVTLQSLAMGALYTKIMQAFNEAQPVNINKSQLKQINSALEKKIYPLIRSAGGILTEPTAASISAKSAINYLKQQATRIDNSLNPQKSNSPSKLTEAFKEMKTRLQNFVEDRKVKREEKIKNKEEEQMKQKIEEKFPISNYRHTGNELNKEIKNKLLHESERNWILVKNPETPSSIKLYFKNKDNSIFLCDDITIDQDSKEPSIRRNTDSPVDGKHNIEDFVKKMQGESNRHFKKIN